jgi:hypothetical protein
VSGVESTEATDMAMNAEPTGLVTVQDLRKIERDAAIAEAQRAALRLVADLGDARPAVDECTP